MSVHDDRERAIERQVHAALPWWRRAVPQWPTAARLLFAVVAAALVSLSLQGSASMSRLTAPAASALSWAQHALSLLRTVPRLLSALLGALPMAWVQAALLIAVIAYLFLFGIGTAAYRLLYLER